MFNYNSQTITLCLLCLQTIVVIWGYYSSGDIAKAIHRSKYLSSLIYKATPAPQTQCTLLSEDIPIEVTSVSKLQEMAELQNSSPDVIQKLRHAIRVNPPNDETNFELLVETINREAVEFLLTRPDVQGELLLKWSNLTRHLIDWKRGKRKNGVRFLVMRSFFPQNENEMEESSEFKVSLSIGSITNIFLLDFLIIM